MPPRRYNYAKAFNGRNNQRRLRTAGRVIRAIGRQYVPKGTFAKYGARLGGMAGGYLAGPGGAAIGSRMGSAGAGYLRKYAGFGDYRPREPVRNRLVKGRSKKGMGWHVGHEFTDLDRSDEIVIEKTEYIGDLITSTTNVNGTGVAGSSFASQNYALNPGLPIFPWLSGVAANFSEYRWEKLIFHFKSTVSDAISSSGGQAAALGEVAIACQYDSALATGTTSSIQQTAYPNLAQMLNSAGACSHKPSQSSTFGVECDRRQNVLGNMYVRTSAVPSGYDQRMYDLGIVQFATANVPITQGTTVDVGQIHVTYKVRLMKSLLGTNLTSLQSSHYDIVGPISSYPLGTSQSAAPNNALPLVFGPTSATASTFSFPLYINQGSFMCVLSLQMGSSGVYTPAYPTVSGGTILQVWSTTGVDTGLFTAAPNFGSAAGTTFIYCFIVSVNAPGSSLCTVTIPTGMLSVAGTRGDLFVTPYNTLMLQ